VAIARLARANALTAWSERAWVKKGLLLDDMPGSDRAGFPEPAGRGQSRHTCAESSTQETNPA
jgi:hypothetical protein